MVEVFRVGLVVHFNSKYLRLNTGFPGLFSGSPGLFSDSLEPKFLDCF